MTSQTQEKIKERLFSKSKTLENPKKALFPGSFAPSHFHYCLNTRPMLFYSLIINSNNNINNNNKINIF